MLSKKSVSRQKFFLVFFVLTLAIIFCYIHLDIALVNFFHVNEARQYNWLTLCAEIPPLIAGVVVVVIYLLTLIYFLLSKTKNIKHWIHIANICSISIFFKDIAKMLFSRYFPDTWFCNNLSYIKHGIYGFSGIFAKLINSSFPSGHVTLVTAFVTSISYFYPRLFYILTPMILLTIAGQVILYYHFLSDVIASLLLVFIVQSIYCEYLRNSKITE